MLFTREGFYSVINAESNAEFQDALCARARRREDLVRLEKALERISYANFKDEVEKVQGREAHDKYLAIWRAAIGLEQKGHHGLYGDWPRHPREPDLSAPRGRRT